MKQVNQCVVCGKEKPEGDHVCELCKKTILEPKCEITYQTEAEIRAAASKVKNYCLHRIHTTKFGCKDCPIKDICYNEPYLWEG